MLYHRREILIHQGNQACPIAFLGRGGKTEGSQNKKNSENHSLYFHLPAPSLGSAPARAVTSRSSLPVLPVDSKNFMMAISL
jgi:hypothetical protein